MPRAWGGLSGEISSTRVSGSRSRQRAKGIGRADRLRKPAAETGQHVWTTPRQHAGNARGLALRAVWNRSSGNAERWEMSEMPVRIALVQAVHIFRSRKPLRVHAAGCGTDPKKRCA